MKGKYCFDFSPLQSIFSKGSWKGGEMFVGGICGKQKRSQKNEEKPVYHTAEGAGVGEWIP